MSDDTDPDTQTETRAERLGTLDRLAERFGRSLTSALTRSAASGRSLDGVLASLGTRLASVTARLAAAPLRTGLTSLFQNFGQDESEGASGMSQRPMPRAAPSGMGASCPSPPAGSSPHRPISRWPPAPG